MPVWVIEDDCLAPGERFRIDYSGPNPFKALSNIAMLFREKLEVGAADVWERDFRWDTTADPSPFYVRWNVDKGMDARSHIIFELIFQGEQPSDPKKDGKLTIFIGARLQSKFPQETFIQKLLIYKGLIWLYNYIFYSNVRRKYLMLCNRYIEELWREFRTRLGMPLP